MSEEERILEVFRYYADKDKFKNLDNIQSFTLNNAIQGLLNLYNKEKEKNKKLEDKIKGMYDKSNKLIEVTNLYLNTSSKLERLENKIKEIIDKIDVEDYYCLNEAEEDLRKLVE